MHRHTLLKLWLAGIAAVVMLPHIAGAAEPATKPEPLRRLTIKVDGLAAAQLSGTPGVTVFSAEKELKPLGDDVTKQIVGKIDFAKEDLVHVSWGSSGPPFGELQYETKDAKEGRTITFFVKEPKADIRGEAFRLGNDFFAVPKKSSVKFVGAR